MLAQLERPKAPSDRLYIDSSIRPIVWMYLSYSLSRMLGPPCVQGETSKSPNKCSQFGKIPFFIPDLMDSSSWLSIAESKSTDEMCEVGLLIPHSLFNIEDVNSAHLLLIRHLPT